MTGVIAAIAVSRCRYLLLEDILGPVSDRPVDQVMPCGLALDLHKADFTLGPRVAIQIFELKMGGARVWPEILPLSRLVNILVSTMHVNEDYRTPLLGDRGPESCTKYTSVDSMVFLNIRF